jgi:peptide/nickel transport system ATP-binding protein
MTVEALVAESLRQIKAMTRPSAPPAPRPVLDEVGLAAANTPGGVPARVVGRPAPARRHRPRHRPPPAFVIADEPVSALDVTCGPKCLTLERIAEAARVFLPLHQPRSRRRRADRRPRRGDERGPDRRGGARDSLFDDPQHPYTRRLLSAIPMLETAGGAQGGVRLRWRFDGAPAPTSQPA